MKSRVTFVRLVSLMSVSASLSLSAAVQAQSTNSDVAPVPPAPATVAPASPIETGNPTPDAPQGGKLGATDDTASLDRKVSTTTWPNVPLLVTGVVVLGGSYAAAAIVGGISDRHADHKLYDPVVGPWLDLNNRECDTNPCSHNTLNKVLLVGDGVLQGVGALSVLLSLVIPETTTRNWYLIGNRENTVVVAPEVGMAMTGLSASGRF